MLKLTQEASSVWATLYYEKTKDYAQLRAIKPWQGRGQQMELSGAGNAAESSTLHWAKRGAICREQGGAHLVKRDTLGKEEHNI